MKAKEAKMLEVANAKYVQAKMDKERGYDNLETIKGMSRDDFREMRERRLYDLPANSIDPFFPEMR